jgi:hypothetical protein
MVWPCKMNEQGKDTKKSIRIKFQKNIFYRGDYVFIFLICLYFGLHIYYPSFGSSFLLFSVWGIENYRMNQNKIV